MGVTDRLKGLDLVDRGPEEPRTEFHNVIQEAATKTIPEKKKYKKAKCLSGEALQVAEEKEKQKAKEKRKDIPN